jgi:hypothetical protein
VEVIAQNIFWAIKPNGDDWGIKSTEKPDCLIKDSQVPAAHEMPVA